MRITLARIVNRIVFALEFGESALYISSTFQEVLESGTIGRLTSRIRTPPNGRLAGEHHKESVETRTVLPCSTQ